MFEAGKEQGFSIDDKIVFVFQTDKIEDKEFTVNKDDFTFELSLTKEEADSLFRTSVGNYATIKYSAKRYVEGQLLDTLVDSVLLVCGTVKYGDDDGEGGVISGSTYSYNTANPNVTTYVASEETLVAHNVRRAKLIAGNSVPASRTIAGISLQNDITTEELKAALGISNITVISTDRPPSGAPSEVDIDLLKVGDTWLQQGVNIVYKLVEAQYNYSPAPGVEPRHSFIWQPLNERYGVGNTEPPTSVTYQAVVYTINEVQWSWLPVPEYFKGDHYLMQIGVDEPPTYYICKSGTWRLQGVCTYTWREENGSGDLSNYYTKTEIDSMIGDIGDRLDRVRGVANE